MATETVLSVTNLNEYVNRLLENDVRLRSVRVQGELTSFKRHSSGHLYFSLKDENALIACVMFRSNAARLSFVPEDGLSVVLTGSVSVYVKGGQYQFYATSMKLAGEGESYRRFLELRDKLGAEGLFDRARPLPFLPRCVGVVTSETGAALHDILSVLERRFPSMNVLVTPALVQGEDAPRSLIEAIRLQNELDEADVLIVGRGGGSYEDLACFNDEALARAIYESRIPVVSAVGHEIDFTIADFVSDLRAPTPSVAAELAVPELDSLLLTIDSLSERLQSAVLTALANAKDRLEILGGDSMASAPTMLVELKRARLQGACEMLERRAAEAVTGSLSRLDSLEMRLRAMDPFAVLKRGYAIVSKGGRALKSAKDAAVGDGIEITLAEGAIGATVDKVSSKMKGEEHFLPSGG